MRESDKDSKMEEERERHVMTREVLRVKMCSSENRKILITRNKIIISTALLPKTKFGYVIFNN